MAIRGDQPGPLFPELNKSDGVYSQVDFTKRFTAFAFHDQLYELLKQIGYGDALAKSFTSHCMKRGAIQILRKLGYSDMAIMRKVFMTGKVAYLNYTENFSGYEAEQVPEFGNIGAAEEFVDINRAKNRQEVMIAEFLQSCSISYLDGCMDSDLFPAVFAGGDDEE